MRTYIDRRCELVGTTHPNSVAEPYNQLLDLKQQVGVLARVLKRRNLSALETFQEGWEKEGGEKRGKRETEKGREEREREEEKREDSSVPSLPLLTNTHAVVPQHGKNLSEGHLPELLHYLSCHQTFIFSSLVRD